MTPSVTIREANANDVEDLLRVINDAFIVEQFFTQGPRVTPAALDDYRSRGTFLVAETAKRFAGCVFVDASPPTGYFGLLSVDRTLQGRGLGSKLVAAAEDHCRAAGCTAIKIRVVNLRTELPPFYRSRDYAETGIEAFESTNTSVPCHFIVMSKRL
jgi:GNAT superfamily N-acetyltransferase